MAKHTTANLRERDKELTLQQHDTDSPLIPVAQIERLHQFRPDLVDWIVKQTQIEAEHRRSEDKRINTFVFVERLIGQIFALLIGLAGIVGGVYAAVNGQAWAGGTIASLAITGLAVVFLTGRRGKSN
ncbi:MAG: hypothetical protein PHE55_18360 [Methylococcaceae bacterium]|nr:hypothetical protein [Methylococcaceae bacterium]